MPKVRKQVGRRKTVGKKSLNVRSKSIASRITDLSFDDGIKINLYGRSGTGKTTLWATFPKPILAIVCSGGKNPGELRSINTAAYRRTVKQFIVKKSSEIENLTEMQATENRFKTVVLDHATGLQDLVLAEILGLNKLPEQSSWGLASRGQYGQMALQMKARLRQLLDLSCNVVIVAQEREFDNDDESEVMVPYIASALSPSVVGWLNPACDYLCETFIRPRMETKKIKIAGKVVPRKVRGKGVQYCLRIGPHDVYTIKFRVPKGQERPEVMADPSFDKIQKLIKGT